MNCKKCGTKMEMERDKVYTSLPPQYGFKCPKCGAFEYSTTPELEDEEKRERYIVHIDENYLQTLYVQNNAVSQEDRMEVYNKVYNEIIDFLDGKTDKPATMAYDWVDEFGNPRHSWWVENIDGQWQSGKAFTKQKPAKPDTLTEDKVYDFYQERSVKAGERADQLAWMFIVMMTGGLISGHAFETFSICASLAAVYMLLSVAQAVWQTFTAWLFKQQIKKMYVALHDYPSWVGGGAWLFFWAKMITIASAVIYFVKAIFF